MIYGYNRISTTQQHLERGEKSIRDFCLSRNYELKTIYQDKVSGKNFSRPRYTVLKEDVLRDGDILIVPELDRLGRNKAAIVDELKYFKEHNIRVIFLDIPTTAVDTSSLPDELSKLLIDTVNSILIELCAVQAESEYTRSKKRQAEGILAKKERGEWQDYGRPRAMSLSEFAKQYSRVLSKEIRPFQLMKELNLTSPTYYRYVKQLTATNDESIMREEYDFSAGQKNPHRLD